MGVKPTDKPDQAGGSHKRNDFDLIDINANTVGHFFIVVDRGHYQPIARLHHLVNDQEV